MNALLTAVDAAAAVSLGSALLLMAPVATVVAALCASRATASLLDVAEWAALGKFMVHSYGCLLLCTSLYLSLGLFGLVLTLLLLQRIGCEKKLLDAICPPPNALDVFFLLCVLPSLCAPSLAIHGYGGAAFVYLWTSFFWRERPDAPMLGFLSLAAAYVWVGSIGLFSPMMQLTSLELGSCICGLAILSQCSVKLMLTLALLSASQNAQSRGAVMQAAALAREACAAAWQVLRILWSVSGSPSQPLAGSRNDRDGSSLSAPLLTS